ncbi:MAG: putative penicillin-binding protein [Candidatus Parcubacteria bacterium]|nr:putative penicillin-binding protein [Candidatus Parcubacteria bacterium]
MKRTRNPKQRSYHHIKTGIVIALSAIFILIGLGALWVATLKIPDVDSFESRKVIQSTKIYDRTGNILLFDTGSNSKRTVVSLSSLPKYLPEATIAIEDSNFYRNSGIEPTSIIRAILADVVSGQYDQGASTITQQVVKNSLLTQDKTITRKIKEWVLAIKLTRVMSKDDILETYLNETSYGGTIFGVEEASQQFFGHPAKADTLGEAAYLAAIPQAPTYYSPFGLHTADLDARQKLVLRRMKELGMLTDTEYQAALKEKVQFLTKDSKGIRAPHFSLYVKDYLVNKYGEDVVDSGGLKVITTLDYAMQQKAEDVIKKFSASLATNFNASNTAIVALDPKSGDILTMVGSRDYFDKNIDGNFNIATARRQPGSTFKPFVYATDFMKGYTPETILFDIKTEFSTKCNPDGTPKNPSADPKKECYSPGEYDNIFEGPLSIRQALAQSRNIPAVEALYLAGISNAVSTARVMGVTITDPQRCGLTLVLGGCEVSLLDLTSAYGVFANDGIRNPYRSILEVDDVNGNVLEKATESPKQAIPAEVARQISSILSDTNVRMNSLQPIGESVGRPVAIKTGTTNDYRDVWTLGYTPNLVVGAWAGNNNNRPLTPNVAGLIISPLWGSFMSQVAKNFPPEDFIPPPPPLSDGKPILRGVWEGGVSYWKDSVSGKVATQYTPQDTRQEVVFANVHSILYWVDKDNPRGPVPSNPGADPQFASWEYAVARWLPSWKATHPGLVETTDMTIPTATDDVHIPGNIPMVTISSPTPGTVINPGQLLSVQLQNSGRYPAVKTEVYLNGKYVNTVRDNPTSFSFVPADVGTVSGENTLSITLYDSVSQQAQATTTFRVNQ